MKEFLRSVLQLQGVEKGSGQFQTNTHKARVLPEEAQKRGNCLFRAAGVQRGQGGQELRLDLLLGQRRRPCKRRTRAERSQDSDNEADNPQGTKGSHPMHVSKRWVWGFSPAGPERPAGVAVFLERAPRAIGLRTSLCGRARTDRRYQRFRQTLRRSDQRSYPWPFLMCWSRRYWR